MSKPNPTEPTQDWLDILLEKHLHEIKAGHDNKLKQAILLKIKQAIGEEEPLDMTWEKDNDIVKVNLAYGADTRNRFRAEIKRELGLTEQDIDK